MAEVFSITWSAVVLKIVCVVYKVVASSFVKNASYAIVRSLTAPSISSWEFWMSTIAEVLALVVTYKAATLLLVSYIVAASVFSKYADKSMVPAKGSQAEPVHEKFSPVLIKLYTSQTHIFVNVWRVA